MTEVLDALFGEKTEAPVETPPATPVESGPARDEGGRFASKPAEQPKAETPAAVAPPAIEQPKAPEPPKQPSEHGGLTGPALAAVLDEREKRKALEAELRELRSKQQPEQIPSIQTDPEGYAAYVRNQIATAQWEAKCNSSEDSAREKHGDALVDEALQWSLNKVFDERKRFGGRSAFYDEQYNERRPVDWVVRQYKRYQRDTEIGDDEATHKAYIEKHARALGLIPNPATAAPAAQSQPAAPQSAKPDPFRQFDSAPSAGGPMTPVVKLNSVEERLFGKT